MKIKVIKQFQHDYSIYQKDLELDLRHLTDLFFIFNCEKYGWTDIVIHKDYVDEWIKKGKVIQVI